MKTAKEWVRTKDPNAGTYESVDFELPHYHRSEWERFVRAIQADTLEAAAKECEAPTWVSEMERRSRNASECRDAIRKLKEAL